MPPFFVCSHPSYHNHKSGGRSGRQPKRWYRHIRGSGRIGGLNPRGSGAETPWTGVDYGSDLSINCVRG